QPASTRLRESAEVVRSARDFFNFFLYPLSEMKFITGPQALLPGNGSLAGVEFGLPASGGGFLPGLPDVDGEQQGKHKDKHQGGQSIDFGGHRLFHRSVDLYRQGGDTGALGEVADDEVI